MNPLHSLFCFFFHSIPPHLDFDDSIWILLQEDNNQQAEYNHEIKQELNKYIMEKMVVKAECGLILD